MSETTNQPEPAVLPAVRSSELLGELWCLVAQWRKQGNSGVGDMARRKCAAELEAALKSPNTEVSDGGPLTPIKTQARTRRSLD